MKTMQIKIKRLLPNAVIPSYAHEGDAGMDLTAIWSENDRDGNIVYHTGIAIEIPYGCVGLIFPRSSIAKYDLSLTNAVGVVDHGYTGEITLKFKPTTREVCHFEYGRICRYGEHHYMPGDRIAQLVVLPYPKVMLVEVEELSDSERGTGGYGSTGR